MNVGKGNKNKTQRQKSAKEPYCCFCHGAHWCVDSGVTMCTALKSQKCGICGKRHTTENHLRDQYGEDYRRLITVDGKIQRSKITIGEEEKTKNNHKVDDKTRRSNITIDKEAKTKNNRKVDDKTQRSNITIGEEAKPQDNINSYLCTTKITIDILDKDKKLGTLKELMPGFVNLPDGVTIQQAVDWQLALPKHLETLFGKFWYFYVLNSENIAYNYSFAESLRTAATYDLFQESLCKEYGPTWIFDIEGTKADCVCFNDERKAIISENRRQEEEKESQKMNDFDYWAAIGIRIGAAKLSKDVTKVEDDK